MFRIILLAMFFFSSSIAADHVKIKFDGDCPESTRDQRSGAPAPRCKYQGKNQSDGICRKAGDTIEWQGSKAFVIRLRVPNIFSSITYSNNYKKASATLYGQLGDGAYPYSIDSRTDPVCTLDPRIIIY